MGEASENPTAASKRRVIVRVVKWVLLGVVLYFVGKQLAGDFRRIKAEAIDIEIRFGFLIFSLLALMVARLMNAMTCARLLGAMGSALPAKDVVSIIWVASLGRYIPGKVAVVVGALMMLGQRGVRVTVAVACLFLSGAMMILLGMITSTPLLYVPQVRERLPSGPVLSGLILAVGLVCLYPPIFLKLSNTALRMFKREELPARMKQGEFWGGLLCTVIRNLCLGLGLFLCSRAVKPIGVEVYPLALGSAGLASVAGFVAVFAPAGLGVHEGIYRITMGTALGPVAGLMVVLFRALHVLADAIAGGAGYLMLRRQVEVPSSPQPGRGQSPHPLPSPGKGEGDV